MEAEQQTPVSDRLRDRFKADAPGSPEADTYTEALVASTLAESVGADSDPAGVLEDVLEGVVKGVNAI